MESDIFDIIENALARAGYKVSDGEQNSIIVRHSNGDTNYVIAVTEAVD